MVNYDFTFSALNIGISAVTKNILLSNVNALIEGGLLTLRSKTKANYLIKVRPGEGSYVNIFWSQLNGTGFGGTFEDKSYRETAPLFKLGIRKYIPYVPLLNQSVSLNKTTAVYSSAKADDGSIAILVSGESNDSFSNKIDMTSIVAGTGNDTIMNSAGNVTIETGANVTITTGTGDDVVKIS